MKLKILPPTLRINNHYLTLDIKSESKLNKDELVSAIWYACLRLYGESDTSAFNLWLMRFYDIANVPVSTDADINNVNGNINNSSNIINNGNIVDNSYDNNKNINNKNHQNNNDLDYYHYKAVLRCQRGYEDKVRGSLALLAKHNHKKIAISVIGISGTIASSIENFIN